MLRIRFAGIDYAVEAAFTRVGRPPPVNLRSLIRQAIRDGQAQGLAALAYAEPVAPSWLDLDQLVEIVVREIESGRLSVRAEPLRTPRTGLPEDFEAPESELPSTRDDELDEEADDVPRILRVRMTGMLFETDKTFLLPDAMRGIRGLVNLYVEQMVVVVTGHCDRVGDANYNLSLSKERARSIVHYLRDEIDDWLAWYTYQPHASVWGLREDQHMLSAIIDDATAQPFYTGDVHGYFDQDTRDAVQRYQIARGLAVDGAPGPQTRGALIADYMQLDGTTLPEGAQVELLGCGEHHNEVPTADGVDEPENRRAEIFLFDPGPVEPAVPGQCPGGGCAYETWKAETTETYDFRLDSFDEWLPMSFDLAIHAGEAEH
ncbi:OmpA family protein [Pseudenhygromyxa sp. WMMC2535]|uniref:peptidoglycan-binding protein n=1 Tax=Pseudenhygromyxa sp. WMMC2535 TaxID=2712867 RepID=UPI001556833D|nr:peptidoglycan-binding protein [Pseudenhygromyxa sp. WMMC2535]NVB42389.1 OmpA family protein [Pseudenhygromyxa sp. WMMC2535]